MKRMPIVMAAVVACLSGCIKIEQKLTLNANASGTFHVEYTVPDETAQRMQAMLRLADELAAAGGATNAPPAEDDFTRMVFDPREPHIRKQVERYAAHGIRIDELEVVARNARREVKLDVSFSNIAEVAKADFFAGYGFSLVKSPAGPYVIYTRPVTTEPADAVKGAEAQEQYKLMAPLLGGFRFALEIQTPTPILRTNADRNTRYTAQWTYDFDSNTDALSQLQRRAMSVTFDSAGLKLPEFKQPEPAAQAAPATRAPEQPK